jgi:hypothetical protein
MAEDNWKSKLATGLIENVPVLLIVLGALLLLLGLTTGIKGWTGIDLPWARYVAIILAVLLIIAGAITSMYAERIPNAQPLGVKITSPVEGSSVHRVVLTGTIAKPKLPKGYELRIIKHYSKGWAPIGTVDIDSSNGTWASSCSIGGTPGEVIPISICLVGRAGKILIDYFEQAAATHENAMKSVPRCRRALRAICLQYRNFRLTSSNAFQRNTSAITPPNCFEPPNLRTRRPTSGR